MTGFLVTLVLVGVAGLWVRRRRARARVLAGLQATKPVFSVEPPRRRMSPLKSETL